MDADAGHLDAMVERLLDGIEPGERREQRGVDVDHPVAESGHELRRQQLHVARQHDQVDPQIGHPIADRAVSRLAIVVVRALEDRRLDPRAASSLERHRVGVVGAHGDDLDPAAPVHPVQDRLQVRPRSRGEHRYAKRIAQRAAGTTSISSSANFPFAVSGSPSG
jgi:hypothetical protein